MNYAEKIVQVANSYLGEKEITGNAGFKDAEFEKRMKAVGWLKRQAWCSYFSELVWREAYENQPGILEQIEKLFSGSATATFKNFDIAKVTKVSQVPVPGALAIYRYGSGWQGHVGIVTRISGGKVFNVEGNTNSAGGREGIEVAFKTRAVKTKYSEKGLNIVGYVHPFEIPENLIR